MRRINCRHPNAKQSKKESIIPYLFDFDKLTYDPLADGPKPVVCKQKTKQSYTKVVVLLLAVGITWFGVSAIPDTMAYFFDAETSGGNSFGAALLDFELQSPGDFAPEVSAEDPAHRDISVTDIKSIAFHYRVHAENFTGDLCEELHFQAFLQGQEKYAGPIKNFQAGDFGFTDPEDWHFMASLGDDIFGPVCAFDLVFSGWQIEFPLIFSGFHEQERLSSIIRTGDTPVDPSTCPFESDSEHIVVEFSGEVLNGANRKTNPVPTFITSGVYDITLVSYDEHPDGQPKERYHISLNDEQGNVFATTEAISDLPDNVEQLVEKAEDNFVVAEDIESITAYYYLYPDYISSNSIHPVCAVFEEQEVEEGEDEENNNDDEDEDNEEESKNQAPEITSEPIVEATACELYTYQAIAVDPDNDILDWYVPVAPDGMAVDIVTGLVNWEPTIEQVGEHSIEVFVEDGEFLEGGLNDFQEFVITVVEGNCEVEPEENPPAGGENNEEE